MKVGVYMAYGKEIGAYNPDCVLIWILIREKNFIL